MNKLDFRQDLNLLFLSLVLSALTASNYYLNHTEPKKDHENFSIHKSGFDMNHLFSNLFKDASRRPASDSCTIEATSDKNTKSLSC